MTQNITQYLDVKTAISKPWVLDEPYVIVEGDIITFKVRYLGGTTISGFTAAIYRNSADKSSIYMVSGDSFTQSENVGTCKKISLLTGNKTYVMAFTCDQYGTKKLRLYVKKKSLK